MKYKMYFNGKRYYGRFDLFKAALNRLTRRAILVLGGLSLLALAYGIGGATYSTDTVHADAPQFIESASPIMDRIADCESGIGGRKGTARQFMPNGDVVTHVNANGLWVDIGKYQINQSPAHIQIEAHNNFNVLTLEGNTAMAYYIYKNEGTGPWVSSSGCWNR